MNAKRSARAMGKRILCTILLLSMMLNIAILFTLPLVSANTDCFISLDGERIDELFLSSGDKITVDAVCESEEALRYKWQIRYSAEPERWIDISKANTPSLAITHALIASLADENGDAYLRCVMNGEAEHVTNTLTVYMATVLDMMTMSSRQAAQAATAAEEPIPTAEEATESYQTCSIVINYLFDNNALAFEPYGASVAYGSSFKETVTSPEIVGYAPFRRIDEDYVEAPSISFDIESVTENITVNVIYEPTLVDFSIHHHLQNLHNDEYSLTYDYITTSRALTGSIVPLDLAFTEAQLPGFKALSYERLVVAADGSTVVEIRYDRNYYLVDFDMSGGYGTEPVYTKFGDTVGANTPIRHGYVFDGWELVSYNGLPPTADQQAEFALSPGTTITVPAANLRYRARWITTQTTYTMVFWQENADDDGYTYWGHLDGLGALSGTLVSGRDIVSQVTEIEDEQYFTFNEGKTDKNVLVEGDGSTVVNVYYTRNCYKLTVKAPGRCTIPVGHVHTDACYEHVCGLGHTHTAECLPELFCEIPEHSEHTASCLICTVPEHTHSPDCSCLLREHTHTVSCWPDVGAKQSNAPNGAPTDPEDGQVFRRNVFSTRYIYIMGSWYRYNGRAASGNTVDRTCGYDTEHTHNDDCLCEIAEHTH